MSDDQVTPQGDQGQAGLGWRAALPDEFKEHEFVKTFQKPGDFVKSAIEIKTDRDALKSKLENSIPKLAADSTDEEKAIYYTSLGRPEKAEGYEFEGDNLDPKLKTAFSEAAFSTGLTKDQAKGIGQWWNGFVKNMVEAETKTRNDEKAAAETALKAELGDKYDASIEMVRRVWQKHSDSEFDKFVNETKIGNDPRLIRFLVKLAKLTGEDTTPASSPSGTGKSGEFNPTKFYQETLVK